MVSCLISCLPPFIGGERQHNFKLSKKLSRQLRKWFELLCFMFSVVIGCQVDNRYRLSKKLSRITSSQGGTLRVLIACEFSGIVREAFRARGHDAWSCDLLPSWQPGPHLQTDVLTVLADGWDLMVAHPPCTYLASSGARWWADRQREQEEALAFVQALLDAPIPKIALENPVGRIATRIRRADQIIQPWQFGHGETKATCLWLKGLPLLSPTNVVDGRSARIHKMPQSSRRSQLRSVTYTGIAQAMASQWG